MTKKKISRADNPPESGLDSTAAIILGGDSEDLLLRRIRLGEQHAMAEIYDRFSAIVYSVSLRILRDPFAAEELMHEVFIQLWRSPQVYRLESSPLWAWFAVVARNRAVDAQHGRTHDGSADDVVFAPNIHSSGSGEPEQMISKLRAALKLMPPDQRSIVELAFFEGKTITEIAVARKDPIAKVKASICSGLSTVRRAMRQS